MTKKVSPKSKPKPAAKKKSAPKPTPPVVSELAPAVPVVAPVVVEYTPRGDGSAVRLPESRWRRMLDAWKAWWRRNAGGDPW